MLCQDERFGLTDLVFLVRSPLHGNSFKISKTTSIDCDGCSLADN